MTDALAEEVEEEEGDFQPEEPMQGPDGAIDCMDGRYDFAAFWLAKLGVEPTGSAITFGEGCSVAILHPFTGEWLTPQEIVKRAGAASGIRRIQ